MDKIRVGVVGVGNMGRHHVRAYASLKHLCELVGTYDSNPGRNREIAESYGIKPYSSMDKLIDNTDALSIVTPTTTHFDIAMNAMNSGVDILLEKPITHTVKEAQRLLQVAKKRQRILQVGHIERFNPAILELPKLLQGQQIIALNVQRMGPYDPRVSDIDVVQDLMIHDIDIVRSLISDPIIELRAFGCKVKSRQHLDYAVSNLVTESGVVATLTASRVTNKKVRKLEIITLSAYIELDYIERKISISRRGNEQVPGNYQQENKIEKVFGGEEDPLKSQLVHFIHSVKHNTTPLITGNDGLEALRIAKQIQNQIYTKLDMPIEQANQAL
ncbi:MAG: Gfo/Idh/MocA family oxidoreductase [Halanaerobium sp.]|nr:Gfo/Idh/MocA family oxidoreductase [Halanaerobium sp.]